MQMLNVFGMRVFLGGLVLVAFACDDNDGPTKIPVEHGDMDRGDGVFGDGVFGDSFVGDSQVGDPLTGDQSEGDSVVGDSRVGDLATSDTMLGDATAGDTVQEGCSGPVDYDVSGVADQFPCNHDSDCAGGDCVWVHNSALNVDLGYCGSAPSDMHNPVNIPLGNPCYLNSSCSSGFCLWGRGLALETSVNFCVLTCTVDDLGEGDGRHECIADPLLSDTYRCEPVATSGSSGAQCMAAEFDCINDLLCLQGYCTLRGCDGCPGTCTTLTNRYGDVEVCVPTAAQGRVAAGDDCLHDIYCSSNTCTNGVCE